VHASRPLKPDGSLIRFLGPVMLCLTVLWQVRILLSAGERGATLGRVITIILLCLGGVGLAWRERRHSIARRRLRESDQRFIAAAENGVDAFFLFDAVRGTDGKIYDFRFRYVNAKAEEMLAITRYKLIGRLLCVVLPINLEAGLFEAYCTVVETGYPLDREISIKDAGINASWLRTRVVKLGDGIAMTSINLSQSKEKEQRYAGIANFSETIFESAPFSIIATDANGVITAMNQAAEKLTQYSRDELISRAGMERLHDPGELRLRGRELLAATSSNSKLAESEIESESQPEVEPEGFAVLVGKASLGGTDEQEWTYIRKDGTRAPVSLAMRAIQSSSGRIEGFVGIASDITDRVQMTAYVTHLATHDQLTGLAGRTLLREKLLVAVERARQATRKVVVFVVDLDHFKRVNDSLGHQAGDQVIREAAEQLRSSVRASDTVARMGGDEFVVVLQDVENVDDTDQFAQSLVTRMGEIMLVNHPELNMTASVGVCIYPDFATDADKLLERADDAMYASKTNGRNQYQVFNAEMMQQSSSRLVMERALRLALRNNEFSLMYQPQVSLRTGEVVGVEALLRWHSARLGQVPPADFIPLAEETGLIVPIGEWVLRQACLEGKQIGDAIGRELCVAINLSPRQFRQNNLLQVIEQALQRSGLAAQNLEIEITENTLMIGSTANLEMLQKIRELGARIAIDDFGTGFCSFSYLLEYKVDRLKIDQSFVRRAVMDVNAAAVVRAVLAMSHGLNIKVVAEGVETDEQLQFLRRRRCDEAQGFLFARPVSAADFPSVVLAIRRERHHERPTRDPHAPDPVKVYV
jgi:diguanylate cyclase (GGDEF)-like protein/PAS domain S-box-containing protein